MLKKHLILLALLATFLWPPMVLAAPGCDGLIAATEEARRQALQDALFRRNETVNQPPASIQEHLSCFGDFTSMMDLSKYDPSSIMSILKNMADSIQNKACQEAKNYLDSNLSQMSGAINSAGQLPYGLGRVYDTRMSTSGVSVSAGTPSTGGITSQVPSSSSLPRVPLPF